LVIQRHPAGVFRFAAVRRQNLVRVTKRENCVTARAMFALLIRILLALRSVAQASASREAEILVLRQQLLILKRRSPARLPVTKHRLAGFGLLYRLFPSLLDAIIIVKPETLLRWYRRDRTG